MIDTELQDAIYVHSFSMGEKKIEGHFAFVGESINFFFFLLTFVEYYKRETRNVIPGIIFLFHCMFCSPFHKDDNNKEARDRK